MRLHRMAATGGAGPASNAPDPPVGLGITCIRLAFGVRAALSAIELSDRIGVDLRDPLPDAVAFVFAGAHCSLHHYVGPLCQCPRVFGQPAEGDHAMPVGAALPVAVSIFPRFLRGDGHAYDESPVRSVMSLGIAAGETGQPATAARDCGSAPHKQARRQPVGKSLTCLGVLRLDSQMRSGARHHRL
jgi:hypothetical protein